MANRTTQWTSSGVLTALAVLSIASACEPTKADSTTLTSDAGGDATSPTADGSAIVEPDAATEAGPSGCQPKYVIRKLDPKIEQIMDLNDSGRFAGVVSIDDGTGFNDKPFVSGVGQPFETFGAIQGIVYGLNNAGAVVGYITTATFQGPFRVDPSNKPPQGQTGWGPGFHELAGYANNPTAAVKATVITDNDFLTIGFGPTSALQFVSPGFGTLTVDQAADCATGSATPLHANETGRIVGHCRDEATQNFRAITLAHDVAHIATDLGKLAGAAMGSQARRVNKSGDVVGESRRPGDGYLTATRWDTQNNAHDLGSLPFDKDGTDCTQAGDSCLVPLGTGHAGSTCCASGAFDINDGGWMVGISRGRPGVGDVSRPNAYYPGSSYAVVWRGGAIEQLDKLTCSICEEPQVINAYETDRPTHCLSEATLINNKGQIIAFGYDLKTDGFEHVLLDPVP